MAVRVATPADIGRMVELSAAKRAQYAHYSPVFWRQAEGADEKQVRFFAALLENERVQALVYEETGRIEGLLIAALSTPPPVYDPGGLACTIDDFTVSDPALWPSVGAALLTAAQGWAKARGAAVTVVVCGHQDEPKRAFLQAAGLSLTSEWYVNPL